jgi:hypothetical protein
VKAAAPASIGGRASGFRPRVKSGAGLLRKIALLAAAGGRARGRGWAAWAAWAAGGRRGAGRGRRRGRARARGVVAGATQTENQGQHHHEEQGTCDPAQSGVRAAHFAAPQIRGVRIHGISVVRVTVIAHDSLLLQPCFLGQPAEKTEVPPEKCGKENPVARSDPDSVGLGPIRAVPISTGTSGAGAVVLRYGSGSHDRAAWQRAARS